jgi:RNA polymerase sigma factor for flagellar operon FliA
LSSESADALARFHAELDLVDLIARQLARRVSRSVTLDDLRSFGREGLLQAARSFDSSRGVPFRRWANVRVRGAMMDGLRQWGALPRRLYRELRALEAADRVLEAYDEEDAASPATTLTTPEAADSRLTAYLAGMATAMAVGTLAAGRAETSADGEGHEPSPEDLLGEAELLARVKEIVGTLPEQERTLVERHYFGGDTLDDAAASLGLSKSWGSRLHARAIETIGRLLRQSGDAQ